MTGIFTIKQHRLYIDGKEAAFKRSPHQSSGFNPEGIILHDTAGRLEKGNSVKWFLNPEARASAHFTVERDGSLTQQVALNCRAWHAGKSRYRGRTGVNAFAFGIEIVNLGRCDKTADDRFKPWFKAIYDNGADGLDFAYARTPAHGDGWWLDYTEAQIKTVTALCEALVSKYGLSFITTHWDISPGRKVDTNPLFPLDDVRAAVFGQQGPGGEAPEGTSDGAPDGSYVITDTNLRRWPSYNDNIITVLSKGTPVTILRSGYYKHEESDPDLWHLVEAGDQQGWIHGSLVELG